MQTAPYRAAKNERIAGYAAKCQTLVSWDVSERKPFPNLPPRMLLFSVRRAARRGLHAHLGTIP
jgi:hypothetical protein